MNGAAGTFSYKNLESDATFKNIIDLRKAKIKKGLRNNTQPYIFIERNGRQDSNKSNEVVRVSFKHDETLSKWLQIVMFASMSDDEL